MVNREFESNTEWATGRITSNNKRYAIMVTCFAVFWSLVSIPCAYFCLKQASTNPKAWIGMIFPACGVIIWFLAMQAWGHWKKFGASVFVMAETPAPIGGTLAGVVEMSCLLPADEQFEIQLVCNKSSQNRRTNSNLSNIKAHESEKYTVVADNAVDHTRIPILIPIPHDGNESGRREKDRWKSETYTWYLNVVAKQSGFDSSYCVPVFVSSGSAAAAHSTADYSTDSGDYTVGEHYETGHCGGGGGHFANSGR